MNLEFLVLLALSIAVVYLLFERLHRTRVFGAPAALGCLGALACALARRDAEIARLPPALQSGWFIPHVTVHFLGYAAIVMATMGAVWAQSAWGNYWDAKETMALATWLIYAAYLHYRGAAGASGRRAAWLAIAGFGVMALTYLGMDLLPAAAGSVHVYLR